MKTMLLFLLVLSQAVWADYSFRDSRVVPMTSPHLLNLGKDRSAALDNYKVIKLSGSVEAGASCGEMNVATNLQSNLADLLNDDFFKGLGNKIQSAGGMLALCYLSPSYCAIAKHMRMSAHFLSQLNLDSCSMIDRYVDSRVSDYELTKQQCMRSEMERNGHDVKAALSKCGNAGDQLADWSGDTSGTVGSNDLLEATAKWAGLSGPESQRVIQTTKALVGDTVVAKGGVQVDFGQREKLTAPRELIAENTEENIKAINGLIQEMVAANGNWTFRRDVDQKVSDAFGGEVPTDIGYETLRKLSFMPTAARTQATERLAKAIAADRVIQDSEKSIEMLNLAARNPNLPPNRQQEAAALRQQLKDQLSLTMEMRKSERDQLANVLSAIHTEGGEFESGYSRRNLEGAASKHNTEHLQNMFYDCSDSVFCGNGGT